MSNEYGVEAVAAAELERVKSAIVSHIGDFNWRIHHLYKIKDVYGNAIQFVPNWAQLDFMQNVHYFNLILKARQLGFSTLIGLDLLDTAIFIPNQSCGIIAQGEDEAQKLLANVLFSYNNLPQWLKDRCPLIKKNTEEIEFANGSKIVAGISLRSGTYQKLHISEYGKTSAKFPEKAKEIKTGALNTVHAGQVVYIESTAEGQSGEFFNMVKHARKIEDEGRELTNLDWKFHFYPWHKHPDYKLSTVDALRTVIVEEFQRTFNELEKDHGILLTVEQKAWYVKKAEIQGDEMLREFPSTPDEAFAASVAGAIYGKQMRILRKMRRITSVPWESSALVHTFWDFGNANYMAIWFFQQVGKEWRMIRYYQDTGKDFGDYIDFMNLQPYRYGKHHIPHDGAHVRMMETGNKTYKQVMEGLGLRNIVVIPVTKSVWKDVEFVCKPALLKCWIDEVNCSDGIKCLDNYRKQQSRDGMWLKEPLHDEHSDGADAFRTFAMGYKEIVVAAPVSFRMENGAPL